jgi:hypothetical protein
MGMEVILVKAIILIGFRKVNKSEQREKKDEICDSRANVKCLM